MKQDWLLKRIIWVLLMLVSAGSAWGQWATQHVVLQPGWNAVYLEVQPANNRCAAIFDGVEVESVWRWNKRFSSVEFSVDPNTLLPEDPHWLVWFPSDSPSAFLTRLYGMSAGGAYLIKIPENSSPVALSIKGQVKVTRPKWSAHALTLVGLPIDPANAPNMADYFDYTSEIDTTKGFENEIYKVQSNGSNLRIVAPARETMVAGKAYWIKCAKDPKTAAMLDVPRGSELVFGSRLKEQDLVLRNASKTDSLSVSIREVAGESAPDGFAENAGMVPLSYYEYVEAQHGWVWHELAGNESISKTLAPNEKWTVRFGVRRSDMANYMATGTNGVSYQSILEVRSANPGLLYRVPVTAEPQMMMLGAPLGDDADSIDRGLWVGTVVLRKVNCPAYSGTNTLAAASDLKMRLIVHVNAHGEAMLLQEIFLARVPLDSENSELRLFYGRKRLPENASEISHISSVVFPLMKPVAMLGSMTNALSAVVNVNCNDPSNPFLHRYNPLHDNKDWDYNTYSNAVETLSISRDISLKFIDLSSSTNSTSNPFFGDGMKGGTYREELHGLRKQTVVVEGEFVLKRISELDQLY